MNVNGAGMKRRAPHYNKQIIKIQIQNVEKYARTETINSVKFGCQMRKRSRLVLNKCKTKLKGKIPRV